MNEVIHELNNSKIAFKTDLGGKELSAFRAGGKALVTFQIVRQRMEQIKLNNR